MGLEVVGVEGLGRVLRDLSRLRLGEVARRAAREWGVVAVEGLDLHNIWGDKSKRTLLLQLRGFSHNATVERGWGMELQL